MSRNSVKLRASCNACSLAKVGCTKERPSCSRCEKRNEPCVYATARRAGRPSYAYKRCRGEKNSTPGQDLLSKHPTHLSGPQPLVVPPSPDSIFRTNYDAVTEVASPVDLSPTLANLTPCNEWPDFLTTFDPFSDRLKFCRRSITHRGHETLQSDPDGRLCRWSAPTPSPTPDLYPPQIDCYEQRDSGFLEPSQRHVEFVSAGEMSTSSSWAETVSEASGLHFERNTDQYGLDDSLTNIPFSMNWNSDGTDSITPATRQERNEYQSQLTPSLSSASASRSSCDCYNQCLDLLRQLTPPKYDPGRWLGNIPAVSDTVPPFESVMKKNDLALKTVGEILECACSDGGSIIFLISFVMLKILGWYAASASTSTGREEASRSDEAEAVPRLVGKVTFCLPGYEIDCGAQNRIAGQLVMSKLERVQILISLISMRLSSTQQSTHRPSPLSSDERLADVAQWLLFHQPMRNPSPSSALAHILQTVLQSCLRQLSQAILDTLLETAVS